jgi:hypothetical protein
MNKHFWSPERTTHVAWSSWTPPARQ